MTPARAFARIASGAMDRIRSHVVLADAASVGAGVRVFGSPRVRCDGDLVVGPGVVLVSTPAPIRIVVDPGAKLVIGAGSVIESGAVLRAHARVVIGRNVRVGAGCTIDDEGVAEGVAVADGTWLDDAAATAAAEVVAPGDARVDAIEDRIRGVIGRVVPSALQAERDADLRLFKEWDSLAALRVLVALEREFSVTLPHDLLVRDPRLAGVTPHVLDKAGRTPREEGAR
jgi:acyl carrier protein